MTFNKVFYVKKTAKRLYNNEGIQINTTLILHRY